MLGGMKNSVVALVAVAAIAPSVSAATLRVRVPTRTVAPADTFTITLSGRYQQSELQGDAYLVSAFQYDSRACQPTGATENALSDSGFFFSGNVPTSPFVRAVTFTAGIPAPRRVCAYLYPTTVTPSDHVDPIATANGFFRVAIPRVRIPSRGVGCHGAFQMPGRSIPRTMFDAVQVLTRKRLGCAQALHIAARARWLNGVQVIYAPQFGGGGWGGPFHVGRWHCYVLGRGSDFLYARCVLGSQSALFYDHRSDWRFPDPGFSPPTRKP